MIKEIDELEKSKNIFAVINLLHDKKDELEQLREIKMKGHLIRSRAKWLQHGEKPSKLFCSLENKHYTEKIVKSIKKEDGSVLTDQSQILDEIKTFYQVLFDTQDSDLQTINLEQKFKNCKITKLTDAQSNLLEGKLTVSEMGQALKNMKNGKTPGIDGFPAEFFKVFWSKLKFIIQRAVNSSFDNNELPLTLRQCIISCLPKGNKDRTVLKNWRPISLLSVLYKIVSASIANRLKLVLDHLVDKTQTGFIAGRYIGQCTRLIYDIMYFSEKKQKDGLLMLIDFEKAFDSISWKFLYNVLEFLGFEKQFIHWIKLFNNNIQGSVLQCGVLSRFFSINRGCRQGDPCSPFLFILAGQILSVLIQNSKEIKGITIGNTEYRLTQFADDTTLIMDGSRESLQAALNTLEVFGSMSGLKMNTMKTKLIWIGRKRFCKEKLRVNTLLEWGITEFSLLGLVFNVDLDKMVNINYLDAITQSKSVLTNWKKRDLTPFGKITVIKTFIISKFNHLFIALPNPSPEIIKAISDMMFKFIWNDKPDKVNRKQICKDGGLKMLDLEKFVKSLKLTWITRLVRDLESPWANLINNQLNLSDKLFSLGPAWCENSKIENPFWKDVLNAWLYMSQQCVVHDDLDILHSPLWFNKSISQYPLFYKTWHEKGITFVSDLINPLTKGFYSMTELQELYSLTQVNALDYYRIKLLTKAFMTKNKSDIIYNVEIGPFIPVHLKIFYKHQKGASHIYKAMNKSSFQPKMMTKWCQELGEEIDLLDWKKIFRACFRFSCDTSLTWLQYRILYRIIGVRKYLKVIGKDDSSVCRLCSKNEESIDHLFVYCDYSKHVWSSLSTWIQMKLGISIQFTIQEIIFGYLEKDINYDLINLLIMCAKKYIFYCAVNYKSINIFALQVRIKNSFYEYITFIKVKNTSDKEINKWSTWEPLFHDV